MTLYMCKRCKYDNDLEDMHDKTMCEDCYEYLTNKDKMVMEGKQNVQRRRKL